MRWFFQFLPRYNGCSLIRNHFTPDLVLHTDACLTGGGMFFNNQAAWFPFTDALETLKFHIMQKEMYTKIVAFRYWAKSWEGKNVKVRTDSKVNVACLENLRPGEDALRIMTKEIWFLAVTNDITILIEHIDGIANITTDILSRTCNSIDAKQKMLQHVKV